MTYESPFSCSVLMSKFICLPRLGIAGSLTRRRRSELLDQLPDLRSARRVRVELQIAHVPLDSGRRVSRRLGALRQLEPGVRVVRLEVRRLLVRGDGVRVGELRAGLEILQRGVDLRGRRLLDLIRADPLAELARREERGARCGELARVARCLVRREVVL